MTETAPRCDNCKYWMKEDAYGYKAVKDVGECSKVVMIWDATEWQDNDSTDWPERLVKPEYATQMSFVNDGSEYTASLWTKPEFFCAHFEKREAVG